MLRSPTLALLAATAAAAALPAAAAEAAAPKVTTLATGLRNPRHLDISSDGPIYVAEAGRGGKGPCFDAAEGPACFGATGGVRVIERSGKVRRLVSGLASYANTPGNVDAIGPHGIVADDTGVLLTTGGPTSLQSKGELLPREDLAKQAPAATASGASSTSTAGAGSSGSLTCGTSRSGTTPIARKAIRRSTPTRSTSSATATAT